MQGVGGFTVASILATLTFFLLGLGELSENTSSSPPLSPSWTRRVVCVRGEGSAAVVVMMGGGTTAVFLRLPAGPPLGVMDGGGMVASRVARGARGGAEVCSSTSVNTWSARFLARVECLVIRSDPVREPLSESYSTLGLPNWKECALMIGEHMGARSWWAMLESSSSSLELESVLERCLWLEGWNGHDGMESGVWGSGVEA